MPKSKEKSKKARSKSNSKLNAREKEELAQKKLRESKDLPKNASKKQRSKKKRERTPEPEPESEPSESESSSSEEDADDPGKSSSSDEDEEEEEEDESQDDEPRGRSRVQKRAKANPTSMRRSDPLFPYKTAARIIYRYRNMLVDWHHVLDVAVRLASETWRSLEDNSKMTEKEFRDGYPTSIDVVDKLHGMIPGFEEEVLRLAKDPEYLEALASAMETATGRARNNDIGGLKEVSITYLADSLSGGKLEPPIKPSHPKELVRGLNHPLIAKLLTPHKVYGEFLKDPEGTIERLKEGKGRYKVTGEQLLVLLYDLDEIDPADPGKGLLKSPFLVKIYKHVFLGPAKAKAGPNDTIRRSKGSNAKIAKKRHVTMESIGLAAVYAYWSISEFGDQRIDEHPFSREKFYKYIINDVAFIDARLGQPLWKEIVVWWTKEIFGTEADSEHSEEESETENELDIIRRNRAQKAAASKLEERPTTPEPIPPTQPTTPIAQEPAFGDDMYATPGRELNASPLRRSESERAPSLAPPSHPPTQPLPAKPVPPPLPQTRVQNVLPATSAPQKNREQNEPPSSLVQVSNPVKGPGWPPRPNNRSLAHSLLGLNRPPAALGQFNFQTPNAPDPSPFGFQPFRIQGFGSRPGGQAAQGHPQMFRPPPSGGQSAQGRPQTFRPPSAVVQGQTWMGEGGLFGASQTVGASSDDALRGAAYREDEDDWEEEFEPFSSHPSQKENTAPPPQTLTGARAYGFEPRTPPAPQRGVMGFQVRQPEPLPTGHCAPQPELVHGSQARQAPPTQPTNSQNRVAHQEKQKDVDPNPQADEYTVPLKGVDSDAAPNASSGSGNAPPKRQPTPRTRTSAKAAPTQTPVRGQEATNTQKTPTGGLKTPSGGSIKILGPKVPPLLENVKKAKTKKKQGDTDGLPVLGKGNEGARAGQKRKAAGAAKAKEKKPRKK